MKILVIGGNRFIGYYAVNELVSDGHDVTVFHRNSADHMPAEVKHIYGNRNEIESFRPEIEKLAPDVVLDMIPIVEAHAEKLINTVKGIAPRIVMISSCDVYKAYGKLIEIEEGEPEPIPITEDSPVRSKLYPYRDKDPDGPMKDYDKILIENRIMNEPAIKGTVMRLPMVYGPRDGQRRFFTYLKRIDDSRPYIVLDENTSNWKANRGYVEDIAHGIVLAVTNEKASGRIYNICEEKVLTENEFAKKIAHYTGWKGKVIVTPPEKHEGFNTDQHLVVDSSRIRKELGYKEITPEPDAYKNTIKWERANMPKEFPADQFDYEKEDELVSSLIPG